MPKPAKESQDIHAAAAKFGRMGGLKGGKARMAQLSAEERTALARKAGKANLTSLTPQQRTERARKAALAYWAKKRKSSTK